MNLKNLMAGLNLLLPYYDDPDGYNIGAEHDIFYAYATDEVLPDEVAAKMFGLGWVQPDGEDEVYCSTESWAAYT